ncbi:MAG: hypothetical protein ACOVNL_03790 [Prochlorococcaceae cyanobacterium]|jgi:hypothetical protein
MNLSGVEEKKLDQTSDLLATGYTSTLLMIASLSLLACLSLLVSVQALTDLEPEGHPVASAAAALRVLKF